MSLETDSHSVAQTGTPNPPASASEALGDRRTLPPAWLVSFLRRVASGSSHPRHFLSSPADALSPNASRLKSVLQQRRGGTGRPLGAHLPVGYGLAIGMVLVCKLARGTIFTGLVCSSGSTTEEE